LPKDGVGAKELLQESQWKKNPLRRTKTLKTTTPLKAALSHTTLLYKYSEELPLTHPVLTLP